MSRGTPSKKVYFYFKRLQEDWRQLLSKAVALNIFSFIAFATVENTLFRWWFDMTFTESMHAREFAMYINTIVAIFLWPSLDDFFRAKMSTSSRKWIRTYWEEAALLGVKIVVNAIVYVKVGIMHGHFAFDLKLGTKIVVIVFLAWAGADFLKYRMVPFCHTLLFGAKDHIEPLYEIKMVWATGKPRIVPNRVYRAYQTAVTTPRKKSKKVVMQEA